jgi:hypothetical protein
MTRGHEKGPNDNGNPGSPLLQMRLFFGSSLLFRGTLDSILIPHLETRKFFGHYNQPVDSSQKPIKGRLIKPNPFLLGNRFSHSMP